MERRRVLIFGAILLFLFIVLFYVLATRHREVNKQEEVIKIGAILPLTGSGAKYGEEAKRGLELARSQEKELNVEIIYEDDQGTNTGAVSAFNKLVSEHKVPVIIGPMYSSTALAIAPLGEKYKVVIFSPSASSPELSNAGKYFFRNWPSDVYEGSVMAKFAYNDLGLRKIGILSVNLDYGTGLTNVFKQTFEKLGGEIVGVEYYDQGATDFKTQLIKLMDKKPDAIYLPGYYAEIGLILKQAKELGLKTKFLSCVGFDNPKVLEIAGDAAEGVIFARPYYNPESEDPVVKNFVKEFEARYGTKPGIYAAHAYDAFNIVVLAIKKGGYNADGIREALLSIKNYPGVTGLTSFDKNGDVIKPIQIMMVRNGRFVEYELHK